MADYSGRLWVVTIGLAISTAGLVLAVIGQVADAKNQERANEVQRDLNRIQQENNEQQRQDNERNRRQGLDLLVLATKCDVTAILQGRAYFAAQTRNKDNLDFYGSINEASAKVRSIQPLLSSTSDANSIDKALEDINGYLHKVLNGESVDGDFKSRVETLEKLLVPPK